MSHHDLDRLIKFVSREPWSACFDEIFAAHLGTVLGGLDTDFEGLSEILGKYQSATLMGCVLEDFFTQTFDVEGGNIIDDYLKRKGWTESTGSKAYIKALRTSVMSLYEVGEVTFGTSFVAHDLIRGGAPVVVGELTASKTLQPGTKLAARIVSVLGRNTMAGGFLVYSEAAQDGLFDGIRSGAEHDDDESLPPLTDDDLRSFGPAFTIAWLVDELRTLHDALPDLRNSDGEDLVFYHIRFPFASGVTQKRIGERLGATPGFDSHRERFWIWCGGEHDVADASSHEGRVVLGNIELKGRELHLFVNSETRADNAATAIQQALADLVRTPVIEIVGPEEIMSGKSPGEFDADDAQASPELIEQALHQLIYRHYLASLDQPIAAFDDKTPREVAKTKNGRRKVADWLMDLEIEAVKNGGVGSPISSYDFGWMWRELGVEDLRG